MTFCLFQVATPYALKQRNLFVLPGEVIEGDLRPGMYLSVPFNSSVELIAPVHAVEYTDESPGQTVAIFVKCDSADDLDLWQSIGLENEDLVITADHP